jgi:hypothetical protein
MTVLKDILESIAWRRYHRGLVWLAVAALGLWSIDHLGWTGLSTYSLRKLGALFTVAASVWGSYRISRDVLRIDPSAADGSPVAQAILQLARAVLVGIIAVAVCVSV